MLWNMMSQGRQAFVEWRQKKTLREMLNDPRTHRNNGRWLRSEAHSAEPPRRRLPRTIFDEQRQPRRCLRAPHTEITEVAAGTASSSCPRRHPRLR